METTHTSWFIIISNKTGITVKINASVDCDCFSPLFTPMLSGRTLDQAATMSAAVVTGADRAGAWTSESVSRKYNLE